MADKEPIPEFVIEALAVVRESGLTNMFARGVVIDLVGDIDEPEAFNWLVENKDRYMDALMAMGKRVGVDE